MNFKIILPLLFFIFFIGCKQLETTQKKTIKTEPDTSTAETTLKSSDEDEDEEDSSKYIFDREYTNQGFALIYDENLFNKKSISKKLDNRGLFIFHTKIRKNSFVKITNPVNSKTVIAQVISNKAIFSNFYNSVITKRIVDELLLDENEPYVELSLISNESTFVAKKAKTFDEEKKVAQKAPVDGITIDNLGAVELSLIHI